MVAMECFLIYLYIIYLFVMYYIYTVFLHSYILTTRCSCIVHTWTWTCLFKIVSFAFQCCSHLFFCPIVSNLHPGSTEHQVPRLVLVVSWRCWYCRWLTWATPLGSKKCPLATNGWLFSLGQMQNCARYCGEHPLSNVLWVFCLFGRTVNERRTSIYIYRMPYLRIITSPPFWCSGNLLQLPLDCLWFDCLFTLICSKCI